MFNENKIENIDLNWESTCEKVTILRDQVIDILELKDSENFFDLWHKIVEEIINYLNSKGLRDKDLRQVASFHILVGGTTTKEMSPIADLEGENSILLILERKLGELK